MKLLHLVCLILATQAEEIYENSTNICNRCSCKNSDDAQTLTFDCRNRNFSHMLASWPAHNATIKATFAGNNLTVLQRLPPTDAVVEVVFSRCNIQVMYPGVFESVINTKFVDLSHNLLKAEEVTAEKFRGPYAGNHAESIALEILDLSYNQIHSFNKGFFEFVPNLERLNLEGNDFVVLDVHTQLALSTVPRLLELNLANNELTELIPDAISSLKSLVELDLSKNDLDFVPSSLVNVGQSLQILILDDNPIIELGAKTFAGLDNLIQISANNLTGLKHVQAGTFVTTPKLQKLTLAHNSLLRDIDPQAFSKNQTIKEVYMNNNNLTTLPFDLLPWSQLDVFEIANNTLDCTCDLYNISRALPSSATRNENGPTCLHPTTARPLQVYSLKSDICEAKVKKVKHRMLRYHFSAPLAGLIVTLMVGLMAAVALGWSRYRRFMRRNEPFAPQVIYSPLLNHNARL